MRDRSSYLLTDLIGVRDQGADKMRLVGLADRIERLCPSHRDPQRFFEDRSEIAHELRELTREARR